MTNFKRLSVSMAAMACLACAGVANATDIHLGTINTATTISSSVAYTPHVNYNFFFTIGPDLDYLFTINSAAGGFSSAGGSGTFEETFSFNSSGTADYTLTTTTPAVPETATWAMMIIGMGAIGIAARRRQNVKVTYA